VFVDLACSAAGELTYSPTEKAAWIFNGKKSKPRRPAI